MPSNETLASCTFIWSGIDTLGQLQCGEYVGETIDACRQNLRHKNILPLKIRRKIIRKIWRACKLSSAQTQIHGSSQALQKISRKSLISFVQQFSILISSSLPLLTALAIICNETVDQKLAQLIQNISNEIEGGKALSEIFSHWPKIFNNLFCSLIKVGEFTGNLDLLLSYLANYLERTERQKRQIIKILLYPTIVFLVSILVTSIIVIFVIPQFKMLYANFALSMPAFTQLILNFADVLPTVSVIIFFLTLLSILGIYFAKKYCRKARNFLDQLFWKIPGLGPVLQKNIILRVARILAITIKSGVPILSALKLAAETAGNQLYAGGLGKIQQQVANGAALHVAMHAQQLFPRRMLELVRLGEESGLLDGMLHKIVDQYEYDLQQLVANLNSLLEPLLIIILGVIVGALIVGMYLPLFRLGMAM